MLTNHLAELQDEQDGVIARRQVLSLGGSAADIERMLRRREWVRVLPGVFLNHTGQPTWQQRAWSGVLYAWPAALSHHSALRAVAGPGWKAIDDHARISLAIDDRRRINMPTGFAVHRVVGLDARVQWNFGPPRVRIEEAVLDVAALAETDADAIALLAAACQTRRTTAGRCLETARTRSRLHRRSWLIDVLEDIANGTCSVLEHRYLTDVERAHGLPRPRRQARSRLAGASIYRDVDYEDYGLVVELDGRLFHNSSRQRDVDLDRDLDVALEGRRTARLGWGQVVGRACRTARKVGALLQAGGWRGRPRECGPECNL
jgi:hypothetical protein